MSTATRRGKQSIATIDRRVAVLERLPACFAEKLEQIDRKIGENAHITNMALTKVNELAEEMQPGIDISRRINLHGVESFFIAVSTVGIGLGWAGAKLLWLLKRMAITVAMIGAVMLAAYAFFGYTPPERLVSWVKVLRGLF